MALKEFSLVCFRACHDPGVGMIQVVLRTFKLLDGNVVGRDCGYFGISKCVTFEQMAGSCVIVLMEGYGIDMWMICFYVLTF